MRLVLDGLAALSTRCPRAVVAVLLLGTVGFAVLASHNEFEVDLTQLGSEESTAVEAMDRIREEFGDPTTAVQVILDAGPDGNVLTGRGLEAVAAAEQVALDALGADVRIGEDGEPQVRSLRTGIAEAMTREGTDPGAAGPVRPGAVPTVALAANPQLMALVSDDVDLAAGSARATVLMLPLAETLTESDRTEAAERVRAAFEDDPGAVPSDVHVTVHSSGLFVSGLLDAIRAEVPLLFGLALLVVLAILGLAYRSVFDVAVGFAGLLATVVWTFGLVALLGPAFLGWTGPLTQLAVIVPVLLVGLGIDYSVHLTARYREQRAAGQGPPEAAGTALRTVGAALLVATAATAVGFASIATAPLRMLADFGVFVAVGVVCALLIMGLLVPSARVWRDRRDDGGSATSVRALGLSRVMGGPARLAQRAPWAGVVAAVVLGGLSLVAATGLEIEFDRDDFIPEGSDIAAVLDHQEELFGGGLTEVTFVLVDGDLTDPALVSALWQAQQGLAGVDGVRTVGGRPQVVSVLSLAAAAGEVGPSGLPADTDIADVHARLRERFGAERVEQYLAADAGVAVMQIRTTVGDGGAEAVQRDVEEALAPAAAAGAKITVTSEPLIMAEMSQELSAFQAQAIALTLAVVLLLLVAYYAVVRRRPFLGAIAMVPALVAASLVLGTMWVLGIAFNVLTATLTAIAIGIGVPYGVHVVNRFAEDLEGAAVGEAVTSTLRSTGGALAGSAVTTLGAFVVLAWSGLPPIRSLGLLGGAGIAFALLAAVLVEPGALVLWARRHDDGARVGGDDASGAPAQVPSPGATADSRSR